MNSISQSRTGLLKEIEIDQNVKSKNILKDDTLLKNNLNNLNETKKSPLRVIRKKNQLKSKINAQKKSFKFRKRRIDQIRKSKSIENSNKTKNKILNKIEIFEEQNFLFNEERNEHLFTDSEFEFYYGEQNLYNDKNFYDNKKYRIFVNRYGNNLRIFKPVCITRETNSLMCKILGVYCNDSKKLNNIKEFPDDFIWPLDLNRHNENVNTIRRIIKENPIPYKLPYVNIDEKTMEVESFTLDSNENNPQTNYLENKFLKKKTSNEFKKNKKNFTNDISSDENIDKNDDFFSKLELMEKKTNRKKYYSQDSENENNSSSFSQISSDDKTKNYKEDKKKNSGSFKGIQPAHCPYCFQLFSATFNAKLHFNGRYKGSGKHISCKIRNTVGDKNLDSIICTDNCSICIKK